MPDLFATGKGNHYTVISLSHDRALEHRLMMMMGICPDLAYVGACEHIAQFYLMLKSTMLDVALVDLDDPVEGMQGALAPWETEGLTRKLIGLTKSPGNFLTPPADQALPFPVYLTPDAKWALFCNSIRSFAVQNKKRP